ncbi:hypothetical protein [Methanobacterium aggregans]|uniref:hypothetical protein n=1 Tax=Methanobacterium aggregans TaxID=1615586 RepID=UPI003159C714
MVSSAKPTETSSGGAGGFWNNQSKGGKIAIGLGVCCIGIILIIAIAGMFAPDATTTTTNTSPDTSALSDNTSSATDTSSTTNAASGIQIQVDYSGSWSGSYGDETGQQSVDGSGTKTIDVSGNPSIVSAVFQKKDDGSGTLTVNILEDGSVVESKSTSAEYGVVSTSHSF